MNNITVVAEMMFYFLLASATHCLTLVGPCIYCITITVTGQVVACYTLYHVYK